MPRHAGGADGRMRWPCAFHAQAGTSHGDTWAILCRATSASHVREGAVVAGSHGLLPTPGARLPSPASGLHRKPSRNGENPVRKSSGTWYPTAGVEEVVGAARTISVDDDLTLVRIHGEWGHGGVQHPDGEAPPGHFYERSSMAMASCTASIGS